MTLLDIGILLYAAALLVLVSAGMSEGYYGDLSAFSLLLVGTVASFLGAIFSFHSWKVLLALGLLGGSLYAWQRVFTDRLSLMDLDEDIQEDPSSAEEKLDEVLDTLPTDDPKARAHAVDVFKAAFKERPETLDPAIPALIEVLDSPADDYDEEDSPSPPQEAAEILSYLVPQHPEAVATGLPVYTDILGSDDHPPETRVRAGIIVEDLVFAAVARDDKSLLERPVETDGGVSEDLTDISGVHDRTAAALRGAGYRSVADVRAAGENDLAEVEGIGAALAARIKADVGDAGSSARHTIVPELVSVVQSESDEWEVANAVFSALVAIAERHPTVFLSQDVSPAVFSDRFDEALADKATPDPGVRSGACRALVHIAVADDDAASVVSRFRSDLTHSQSDRRHDAAYALALLANSVPSEGYGAVDVLVDDLSHSDPAVRESGADTLRVLAADYPEAVVPAVAPLTGLLDDADVDKYAVAAALGHVARDHPGVVRQAVPGLTELLEATRNVVRLDSGSEYDASDVFGSQTRPREADILWEGGTDHAEGSLEPEDLEVAGGTAVRDLEVARGIGFTAAWALGNVAREHPDALLDSVDTLVSCLSDADLSEPWTRYQGAFAARALAYVALAQPDAVSPRQQAIDGLRAWINDPDQPPSFEEYTNYRRLGLLPMRYTAYPNKNSLALTARTTSTTLLPPQYLSLVDLAMRRNKYEYLRFADVDPGVVSDAIDALQRVRPNAVPDVDGSPAGPDDRGGYGRQSVGDTATRRGTGGGAEPADAESPSPSPERPDVSPGRTERSPAAGESTQRETGSVGSEHTDARQPVTHDSVPTEIPSAPSASVDYGAITGTEPIGSGGNADVMKATLPTPDGDVTVALKEPRMAGTVHTEAVQRLLEEAETWDRLDDHDHIVGVVDYDSQPVPWIAMEYMDGGHLGERAEEIAPSQALWTAIVITKGVRHAHRRGVAHLDLKPENILFRSVEGAWDVPKVADWGLSKHLLEHSKSIEGLSPQYAAPEQFDADAYGTPDDLTDVYQLGAVLYELFTGRPPFEGQPTMVMRAVLEDDPTPPSEVADVPPGLDDVLLTALAKERADRYESVLLLRNALQDVYDGL